MRFSEWLFTSPKRKTVDMPWRDAYCIDAQTYADEIAGELRERISDLAAEHGASLRRGDALAYTIRALADLTTTDHESKEDFIQRVKGLLSADPDERLASLLAENKALRERTPEQEAEEFLQAEIDAAPEPMRRLGQYLAEILDEDKWKTAERMLNAAILSAAPPPPAADDWILVSESLPDAGKMVLAYYKNRVGGDRIIKAFHAPKFTLSADACEDEGCYEFDEATNSDYMREGWLEAIDNWGDYSSVYVVEGEVTHWIPLPAAPSISARKADGKGGVV